VAEGPAGGRIACMCTMRNASAIAHVTPAFFLSPTRFLASGARGSNPARAQQTQGARALQVAQSDLNPISDHATPTLPIIVPMYDNAKA
jgi:hypothetical protein